MLEDVDENAFVIVRARHTCCKRVAFTYALQD